MIEPQTSIPVKVSIISGIYADWQLSQRHHSAFLAVAFLSFQFRDKKATLEILENFISMNAMGPLVTNFLSALLYSNLLYHFTVNLYNANSCMSSDVLH